MVVVVVEQLVSSTFARGFIEEQKALRISWDISCIL
jgi:hypothetical protein